jgi:DNA-binding beta-propeller fold protein YncE
VLAKGLHDVHLSGTTALGSKIDLQWAGADAPTAPIPSRFIYNGSTGGLSGEFVPFSSYEALRAPDPLGPTPRFTRRSDAFFGYRAATDSLGQSPFVARWQGWLAVPQDGTYIISTASNGPSVLFIDGEIVVDNSGNPTTPGTTAQLPLTKGRHAVDLRYAWVNGRATFELFWTPPDSEGARIIPPTALEPLARSWPRNEIPDAPIVQMPRSQASAQLEVNAPARIMGGLSNPRGIAVDAEGNTYVGDRGNGRVVVFGREGNEIRSWGKPAPQDAQDPAPGEFVDISDLAVGPDGTVYVMDLGAHRLYLYTREGQLKLTVEGGLLGTASPNGIGISTSGDLHIASTAQSRIVVYPNLAALTDQTKTGIPDSTRSITGGDGANRIEQPLDVAPDPTNPSNLYVADLRDRIALVTAANNVEHEWLLFTGREDGGGRLAISPDGKTLYMSDPDRNRVSVVNVVDGTITYFGGPGTDPGLFRSPGGIAVDPEGRVYVLDRGNGRVQVFDVRK